MRKKRMLEISVTLSTVRSAQLREQCIAVATAKGLHINMHVDAYLLLRDSVAVVTTRNRMHTSNHSQELVALSLTSG